MRAVHCAMLASMIGSSVAAQQPVAGRKARVDHALPQGLFLGELRGPYRTGTYEELWVADGLPETRSLDPNDRTHLMVRIWYPADMTAAPEPAPYVLHPEVYINADDHWLVPVKGLPTNSGLSAPLAPTPERFPVLLYNHGGGNPNFSATFQTEFLASHGYIVVAIGHPGWDGIHKPYPDGYAFKPDAPRRQLTKAQQETMSELQRFRWMWEAPDEQVDSKRQTDEISYVIDRLTTFDGTPGHSFLPASRSLADRIAGLVDWGRNVLPSGRCRSPDPRGHQSGRVDVRTIRRGHRGSRARNAHARRGRPRDADGLAARAFLRG